MRVLLWKGAPIPLFRPSRGDVREVQRELTRHTKIQCAVDSCTGASHCHHEKTIVIDDRDRLCRRHRPHDRRRRPLRHARATARAAVSAGTTRRSRIEGPAVHDVAEHFRLRWHGCDEAGAAAARPARRRPATSSSRSSARCPQARTGGRKGDYSILESYVAALRSAEHLVYLENQFLWSPEIVDILREKLDAPPTDDFRIVVLLPARANDGADISRGQVAALIEADGDDDRFLACTVYAREGTLRDIVYVHAKIGIVDDRWLTVGSANLNAHSLLHDTEMNVVTHDEELARATRLRLWAEHLERDEEVVAGARRPRSWTSSGGRSRPSSSTGSSGESRSRTARAATGSLAPASSRRSGRSQSHLYDI